MSVKHPVIAITGSSGAGTTTVQEPRDTKVVLEFASAA